MPIKNKRDLYNEVATLDKAHDVFFTTMAFDNLLQTDRIIRDKGRGSLDYYDMMVDSDSHVAGLIETRIDAVTGLDWEVVPVSDEDEDKLQADFITFAFERLGNFDQALAGLLRALVTGFAVAEVVWEDITWEGTPKIVPEKIILRRSQRFRFDSDYSLRLLSKDNSVTGALVDDFKFIVHSFRPRYSNPYGVSVLRAVYWPWWFKHHSFTWWLKAAEKGAEGTCYITYPEHANEAEIAQFEDAAKRLLLSKYGAVREGAVITFPEIKIDPNFSDNLVSRCNSEMRFRVMGSTLSAGTEGSGTRALGQVHEGRFQERIEADSKSIMAALNRQLIRWMIDLNFAGEREKYPTFKLHFEPSKDTKAISEVLEKAVAMGIPVSVKDAAALLNIPMAQEGDELLEAPTPPAPPAAEAPPEEEEEEEEEQSPEEAVEEEGEATSTTKGAIARTFRPKKGRVTAAALPGVEKRAAYFQERIDKLGDAAVEDGLPIYAELGDQIQEWAGGYTGLLEALDNIGYLNLDVEELALYLRDSYYWSELIALHDVYDLPKSKKQPKYAAWIQGKLEGLFGKDPWDSWAPVDPETAIELFERREILERFEFDLLEAEARRNALTAARMSKDTIEKRLAPALTNAIKAGTTQNAFIKEVDDIVLSRAHANTIFRTNVLSAYNNGHAEAIFSPNLKELIPAFQFIAVMDDRTTPMCAERNDAIYNRDDMVTLGIVPPLHFNCRSTLVGVYADEWNKKTSLAPIIPTERGFGKWSPVLPRRVPVPAPIAAPETPIRPQTPPSPPFQPSENIRDIWPAYSEAIRDDCSIMLTRMGSAKVEYGAVYLKDGKRIARIIKGKGKSINLNGPVGKAMRKKQKGLTTIHTHPSGGPLSPGDVEIFSDIDNIQRAVILTRDSAFILEKSDLPEWASWEFAQEVSTKAKKRLQGLYKDAVNSKAYIGSNATFEQVTNDAMLNFVNEGIVYKGKTYYPFNYTSAPIKEMGIGAKLPPTAITPLPTPISEVEISAKARKAWPGYSSEVQEDMQKFWKTTEAKGIETGGVYSSKGKRVWRNLKGSESTVNLAKGGELAKQKGYKNYTTIHTHPTKQGGGGFSASDLSLQAGNKSEALQIAYDDQYVYISKKLTNLSMWDKEKVRTWYSEYIGQVLEGVIADPEGTHLSIIHKAVEALSKKGVLIKGKMVRVFDYERIPRSEFKL